MRHFLAVLSIACFACFVACEEEPQVNTSSPMIILENTSVEVVADGNTFTIDYTVENAVKNERLTVTKDVDWITDISISETHFSFSVEPNNETEGREAVITVSYPDADDVEVDVVQLGFEPKSPFDIQILSTTELSYVFRLDPLDPEMEFIFLTDTEENFEKNNIETGEDILAYNLETFRREAEIFGTSVEQLVRDEYIFQGVTTEVEIQGVAPGKGFIIYAYGVKIEDGLPVATTEVVMAKGHTKEAAEPIEMPIEFSVTLDGCNANIYAEPGDYTGRYFIYVFETAAWIDSADPTQEDYIAGAMDAWYYNLCRYLDAGFSTSLILEDLTWRGSYKATMSLDADTDYFAVVVPVQETGIVYAYPTVYAFSTPVVSQSSNVIELSVSGITSRGATVTVSTTNDDPYILTLFGGDAVRDMSDQEIMDYYISNYGSTNTISGDFEYSWSGLDPAEEYCVIAFGCEGGTVTTDLVRCSFTTLEEKEGDLAISFKVIGHFDTKEVAALNSDYEERTGYDAMFAYEIITEPKADLVYRALFKAEQLEGLTDEYLKEYLLYLTPKETFEVVNYVSYDYEYVLCAIAVTADGLVSDLLRTEPYAVTYETRGNAQDFIDYKHPSGTPSSLAVEMAETAEMKVNGTMDLKCFPVKR